VAKGKKEKAASGTGANLGFEAKLWQAADALRNNMDAAEYKHVVLGLIFLKYISDAFEAKHAELEAEKKKGADPEDPDEYRAASIFWVPKEARWAHLKASAPQPTIGSIVDEAMSAIERDNPSLKGVLPKDFGRPNLDKIALGRLINMVSDIALGSAADRAKDTLGRVYEYFLAQFASAEGKKGGQFYTPSRVVRVLVAMLAPYKGRVYDPCCGSGGMFVSSEKFIEAHSGKIGDISIYVPHIPESDEAVCESRSGGSDVLLLRVFDRRATGLYSAERDPDWCPAHKLRHFARDTSAASSRQRTTRHRPHPGHAERQDRAEPADERDA
jgi:type I restriction enzyme M protein